MIIHVIHSLCYGGIETGVVRISNIQVIKTPVILVLVAPRPDMSLVLNLNPSIRVIKIAWPKNLRTLQRTIKQFSRIVNNEHAPVFIHLHLNLLNWLYIFIIKLFCSVDSRIYSHSYTTHNILGNGLVGAMLLALNRMSTIFVSGRVADSKESASYVYGKNKEVHIINMPTGVNKADLLKYFKKQLNEKNRIVLGNIGRLAPVKNQEVLLKVLADLVSEGGKVELRIIGSGPLESALRQMALKLGVQDLLTIQPPQSDIVKAFQDIDIFLFPSLSESLPGTLIEAQLLGIRCVSNSNIDKRAIVNSALFNGVKNIHNISEWTKLITLVIEKELNKELIIENFKGDFSTVNVTEKFRILYAQ